MYEKEVSLLFQYLQWPSILFNSSASRGILLLSLVINCSSSSLSNKRALSKIEVFVHFSKAGDECCSQVVVLR